jgi:CubicO group peptidase (beta-lactamase class C family)
VSVHRQIDALVRLGGRTPAPGYAVGVMRNGKVVHAKGYGIADLEHGAPITPATVFHAASLSKQFTACAVLMLEAAGKLSLGDRVAKHVPGMPACAAHITLRHLLHHTSGLRDQWPLLRLAGWREMDERTEEDVLDIVRSQDRLNFQPGETFAYCNTGYTLLAHVVSRVSCESLRTFTTRRIFNPLGMRATHFRDDHREVLPGRAYGYTGAGPGRFGFWVPNFDLVGPTSLHTTVGDLLTWARALVAPNGALAGPVQELLRPGSLNDGRQLGYGAGVGLATHRGLELVRHSGWDLGYVSHLAVYPKEGCAVAILGNLTTLTPWLLARKVAELCLDGRFPGRPARPVKIPKAQLAKKAGLYRHRRTGRALWVNLSDGALVLGYSSPPSSRSAPVSGLRLDPLGPTTFIGDDRTTEVRFDDGTVSVRGEFGVDELFERDARSNPSATALAACEGTYRSSELGTAVTVRPGPGRGLVVTQHRGPARPLSPAYDDAFTDDNKATYRFTRNAGRDIDGMTLELERVHHMRLDRVG